MDILKYIDTKVSEILKENHGISNEIAELSRTITPWIIENVQISRRRGTNFQRNTATFDIDVPREISDVFPVNQIHFIVGVPFSDNGVADILRTSFDKTQTKSNTVYDRQLYNIELEIYLEWDFVTDISAKLRSTLAHELHHVLDYIERIKINSKTTALNLVYTYTNSRFPRRLFNDYPALMDFLYHFYLTIPQEVNARVQEAFSDVEDYFGEDYQALIRQLYRTKPLREAQSMINYNINDVLLLSDNVLMQFIQVFNQGVRIGLDDSGFVNQNFNFIHINNRKFFTYWKRRINFEGDKLFRKIIKMVSKKSGIDSFLLMKNMNRNMLNEILWYQPFRTTILNENKDYDVNAEETDEDIIWNKLIFKKNGSLAE